MFRLENFWQNKTSQLFFFFRRITSRHPNDPRQPFYNTTGAPMKPLAKLTMSRQRLYKKSCGNGDYEDEDGGGMDDEHMFEGGHDGGKNK